jgi:hypothetical protein
MRPCCDVVAIYSDWCCARCPQLCFLCKSCTSIDFR